jgi:PAS domain S-box-containing protein
MVLVFVPVPGESGDPAPERPRPPHGFIAGLYDLHDMIEAAPGIAGALSSGIALRFVDRTPPGEAREFYRAGEVASPSDESADHRVGLEVAGRQWEIVADPGGPYRSARRAWEPWAVLLLGLLGTGALVAYVRIATTRARTTDRVIEERTADLREANERLDRQRELLQSILDNLGDGVAVTDEHGRLTVLNPAAREILGVTQLDVGPERWSSEYGLFYPGTDRPVAVEDLPLARAVAGQESGDVELFVRNPKRPGGVFIRVNATPLRDDRGRLRGGVAVFRDISERKWAEAVLRDSEARFRTIVEASACALIILSSERRICEFNPHAEQLFGVARARALGENFLELCLPEEYREAVSGDIERVLAGESTPGFEVPAVREGAERTVLWGFSRLAEPGAGKPMVIATGHDITERRQAEQARRVRELAAYLQSAREGERAHVAREIHDELGQALTGLKFEVSLLSRKLGSEDPELSRRLQDVGRSIDTTIGSVRRIVTELRPQILDELGLLEAVRWHVAEFEKRTGVRCTTELPEEPPDWSTDRTTAMFRILQEALTNVARHAEAKQVRVRLERREDRVLLEIRDDGKGFSRERAAAAASFGLLGMEERARMFGGSLEVVSRRREGTTVTVSIPH